MRRKLRNAIVLSRNASLSFSSLSKSHSLTLSCRSQSRQTSTKVMFFKFCQLRCLVIFVNFTCDIGSSKIWVIAHCRNGRFDFDISHCAVLPEKFGVILYYIRISYIYIRTRTRLALLSPWDYSCNRFTAILLFNGAFEICRATNFVFYFNILRKYINILKSHILIFTTQVYIPSFLYRNLFLIICMCVYVCVISLCKNISSKNVKLSNCLSLKLHRLWIR